MTDFVIESANQELGRYPIIAGDTQRMRADFTPYLGRGDVLQAFTLGCTSVVSTVTNGKFLPAQKVLEFYVTVGTAAEVFTVSLQVVTSLGETLNYTIIFEVQPQKYSLSPCRWSRRSEKR